MQLTRCASAFSGLPAATLANMLRNYMSGRPPGTLAPVVVRDPGARRRRAVHVSPTSRIWPRTVAAGAGQRLTCAARFCAGFGGRRSGGHAGGP
jgi:hypothetical protein